MIAYDSGMRARTSLTRTAKAGLLPVFALSMLLAPLVQGQGRADPAAAPKPPEAPVQAIREPVRTPDQKMIDRIVREIEAKHKARVVRAPEQRLVEGRRVLVFRLLDDKNSNVFEISVDAETGKEL